MWRSGPHSPTAGLRQAERPLAGDSPPSSSAAGVAPGDFQPSCPGPGPHGRAIGCWAGRAAGGTAPAAGRCFPAGLDERSECLLQLGLVLLAEVDFVADAAETERDRLSVLRAIKVVGDDHRYAPGHGTDSPG